MALDKTIPLIYTEECGYVPTVLVNAGELIEKHITTKHLFQTQGSSAKVKQLMSILNVQKMPNLKKVHVHDVVEVIKLSLSGLSNQIIPKHVLNLLMEANQSHMKDYTTILTLFHQTSPLTFSAVHYVMRLLNKIMQHSETNGMNVRKLATIFVLDILKSLTAYGQDDFTPDTQPKESEGFRLHQVEKLPYLIMVVEQLILKVSAFKDASRNDCTMQLGKVDSMGKVYTVAKDTVSGDTLRMETLKTARIVPSVSTHLSHCRKQTSFSGGGTGKPTVGPDETVDDVIPNRVGDRKEKAVAKWKNITLWKKQGAVSKRVIQLNKRKASLLKSTLSLSSKEPPTETLESKVKRTAGLLCSVRPRVKKNKALVRWRSEPRYKTSLKSDDVAKEEPVLRKQCKRIIFYRKDKESGTSKKEQGSPHEACHRGPFQHDEELLPWTNVQSETEDSSTMQRTIEDPHVHQGERLTSAERSGNSSKRYSRNQRKLDVRAVRKIDSSQLRRPVRKLAGKSLSNCKAAPKTSGPNKSESTSVFNTNWLTQVKNPLTRTMNSEREVSFAQMSPSLRATQFKGSFTDHKQFLKDRRREESEKLGCSKCMRKRRGRSWKWLANIFLLCVALLCTYPLYILFQMGNGTSICHQSQFEFFPLQHLGFCKRESV